MVELRTEQEGEACHKSLIRLSERSVCSARPVHLKLGVFFLTEQTLFIVRSRPPELIICLQMAVIWPL